MNLTAVILRLNEAHHLPRCLGSLEGVVDHVLVADSFSGDETGRISKSHGAQFVQHAFVNHASQLNWALTNLTRTAPPPEIGRYSKSVPVTVALPVNCRGAVAD